MLLTAPSSAPTAPQDPAKRCFLSGGWKTPPPPSGDGQDNADLPALAHAFLKHLTLAQMEQLAEAVERGVGGHSDCLRIEERFVTLGRYGEVDIVQLVCRLFRWPKTPLNAPLVNFCDDEEEVEKEREVCANPYHWSLTMDLPPAASSATSWKEPLRWPLESPKDRQCLSSTEDSAIASSLSSEPFSSDLCSGPWPASPSSLPPTWCSLSYWELLTHVGARWFPVRHPRLYLGASAGPWPPPDDFLDVAALQQRQPALRQPVTPLDAELFRCVSRARRRIAAGIVLLRRGSKVWLHNRSTAPVFVSPQCGTAEASARRLPPDHALAIFDLELWRRRRQQRAPSPALAPPGPIDPRVVHVSFGKGWGPNYKRQDITLCPCRLEILFHLPKV